MAKYKYGFFMPEDNVFKAKRGLDESVVRIISNIKKEPEWMLDNRLAAYQKFLKMKMPSWGADLSGIDFANIFYYVKASQKTEKNWNDVPADIKTTYDRLGIPEAEKEYLGGVKAQYESEVVYGSLMKRFSDLGIIFCGMDEALEKYPKLVKEYFGTLIPMGDNKFAALNTAVWSGGSFIYVPKNVKVDMPLQAYFRINSANMGQFERTLMIIDEGAFVHYVEGCSAPVYSESSIHSAVVEIFVKKGARCRYTTIQNWSTNVYNLVTKRAKVETDGVMEWIDGNLGSKITMKYPSVVLVGQRAHGEILSVAVAGRGQHQDAGGKCIHLAPDTTSRIISKSISMKRGRASYRGMIMMAPGAKNARSKVVCDALILDKKSRSDTYPVNKINESEVTLEHEATVSKIGEEQIFYLMSRGFTDHEAEAMIINGFIEPIVKELPMEYSVELNRLINLQMEGSVG
ncbi:Fe-S cluster assembly protein SufB [Candidatus Shapirobacteria bacterium CG_4_8_14_3_um_filter_35_11]|uniref:Fe-S cluster assembly protein SufB n=4 Tax=Candidatus Shapironibacteriota TaxID=1752721 RepID=A0A1J5HZ15_9BACT|nr:MAG: Fe-S cluster assembly protein SufB [Candidatus Shapirobacteria bacterium CG2_30_35_20]PIV07268.1 MAG: Fe-S cluster assembly protein SufB [Candidatus Shapirobacteria bacterium CG03_land_8_20_14_0_80_35_14]PIX68087.1 MAG: Fe-S cluster assembly protein SufB [Candidatus Shapirobacteria bacterium CG_4_10_14_3_um_filter_35_13]PJC80313.1 MAG: Fe-S cluster assembly protein SufB [Candidatus Shapirobacteria bacterium CG_4_8_14_3_um_filter_35_11]